MSGEEMQEVNKFDYLEVIISTDGCMGEEVAHRVLEGRNVWGMMTKLWKENVISREVKWELYERVVILTVVYGSETLSLSAQDWRKIEVFEMMCLRNICGVRRVDRVRNAIIRKRCGCELNALERIERNVLKCFRHVERVGEERLVKRVYQANVEGNRGRGRPQKRLKYEVKDLQLGREGMLLGRDRDAWVGMVYRSE